MGQRAELAVAVVLHLDHAQREEGEALAEQRLARGDLVLARRVADDLTVLRARQAAHVRPPRDLGPGLARELLELGRGLEEGPGRLGRHLVRDAFGHDVVVERALEHDRRGVVDLGRRRRLRRGRRARELRRQRDAAREAGPAAGGRAEGPGGPLWRVHEASRRGREDVGGAHAREPLVGATTTTAQHQAT